MTRLCAIVSVLLLACSSAPASAPTNPTSAATDDDDSDTNAPAPPPPTGPVGTGGNHGIRAFEDAKKELTRLYTEQSPHLDLYCGCTFESQGHGMHVDLDACGYVSPRDHARAERIEWEHAVPAAAFGHTFAEWTGGDPRCVDARGRHFKGRKCAHLVSAEFARIEGDMHNLFPVVGEVNGLRSDFPMGCADTGSAPKPSLPSFRFGACGSTIDRGVFFPRKEVRGDLARAYKYMDRSYPERHLIDDAHRPLFDQWDHDDPPDAWEKARNRLIAARQGNANPFIGD